MTRRQDMLSAHDLGKKGEEAAVRYLRKKKYSILQTGFRLHRGEIDIIARNGRTIVFVEVKTRSRVDFGFPEEYVTVQKQSQIKKIARGFCALHHLEKWECRFDVIALVRDQHGRFKVAHFPKAFE
jgi:putative endonuclease